MDRQWDIRFGYIYIMFCLLRYAEFPIGQWLDSSVFDDGFQWLGNHRTSHGDSLRSVCRENPRTKWWIFHDFPGKSNVS